MARRYFGTDGVRGVVGEFLTPELVERLGRAAATLVRRGEGLRRPRHARVGRRARGGVRARRRLGRRRLHPRRRAADARGRAARARPRRRHLRVAQPARVQRRQVLRLARAQALGPVGGADRGAARRAAGHRPGPHRARRGRDRLVPRRTSSSASAPTSTGLTDRRRLRERRVLGARAARVRRAAAPRCTRSATRPTATNINVGCGATDLALLQRTVARAAASTSASRSTATATACSRSTSTAGSSTATRSSRSSRST